MASKSYLQWKREQKKDPDMQPIPKQYAQMFLGDYAYIDRQSADAVLETEKKTFKKSFQQTSSVVKTAYRKATQQKPKFVFGSDLKSVDEDYTDVLDPLNRKIIAGNQNLKAGGQREKWKYNFKAIYEQIHLQDQLHQNQTDKRLTLQQIDMIGEPEYERSGKEYQMHTQIMELLSESVEPCKAELKDREFYKRISVFENQIALGFRNMLFGKYSKLYSVDYLKDLKLPLREKYVPKSTYYPKDLNKITGMELLSYAGFYYRNKDFLKYLDSQDAKAKAMKQDENLEQKYKMVMDEIYQLKEMGKRAEDDKVDLKREDKVIWTVEFIKEEPIHEITEINTQRTLKKISELAEVREQSKSITDIKLKDATTKRIGSEMRKNLFQLLMSIIKDEKFVSMAAYMHNDDLLKVENSILEKIYFNLKTIKGKMSRSGESKMDLLNIYLNQRRLLQVTDKADPPPRSLSPISKKKGTNTTASKSPLKPTKWK